MAIHFNIRKDPWIRRIANAVNKAGRPFLYAAPSKMLWIRPFKNTGMITKCSYLHPQISSDNPIHNILSIEGEVAGKEKTAKAYTVINDIIKTAKEKITGVTSQFEKLQKLYGIIRKDFEIQHGKSVLLSEGLAKEEKTVDCNTGSFIFIAVAHELGWPVSLAVYRSYALIRGNEIEGHAFIFWQNSENKYLGFETTRGGDIGDKDCDLLKQEAGLIVRNGRDYLFANVYYNRGVVYNDLGRHTLAIEDYTKAIGLRPDFADAYYNRGNACRKLGEHDRAIEDYTRAIELKPDFAEAYYNRGVVSSKLGKHDMAIKDRDKAIELRPDLLRAAVRFVDIPNQE